jgi:hypothetical protein
MEMKQNNTEILSTGDKKLKIIDAQLIKFLQFRKERATKGDKVESTISNYFKAIKLICHKI